MKETIKSSLLLLLAFLGAMILSGCVGQPQPTSPAPTPFQIIVTRGPTATRNPIGSADHSFGADKAFLTIVMYGDFQSQICDLIARTLAIIQNRYPDDVRLVWRHFPQGSNDKAMLAAEASEAANVQGRFWEMHDQLYVHQADWAQLDPLKFRAALNDYAKISGVADLTAFNTALDQHTYMPLVQKATAEATQDGVKAAPVLLFNGTAYSGRIDDFALDNFTRLRLLEKRWFAHQPDFTITLTKHYTATLVTEKGNVVIDLLPRSAPATVNNFVFLARAGWYNNISFHRVIPGMLAQTGDPSGSGQGTAGYNIIDEKDNGLIFDREGMVAMANAPSAENSASSQFFITYGPLRPAQDYDKQYTIFGQVKQGMDVLRKLTPRDPEDELHYPNPPPGDKLITVKIDESN